MAATGWRLLLADPEVMFRDALAEVLVADGHLIVARTDDGPSTLSATLQHQPDVVLVETALADHDGIATVRAIVQADRRQKVVALSRVDDHLTVRYALQAGAVGFVSKNEDLAALTASLRTVMDGDVAISPLLAHRLVQAGTAVRHPVDPLLSEREEDVLREVARGLGTDEIAATLFISRKTVKNHLSSIYDKLGVSDKTQALVRAARLGIVTIE